MTITIKRQTLMNINFLGPVLPTDSFTQMAFVEILNIILTSDKIGRASCREHFRWSYANDHFTLWQRMEYNSPICFGQRIFSIHFGMLASRDRKRNNMIMN